MNRMARIAVVIGLVAFLAGCQSARMDSFENPVQLSKIAGYAGMAPNSADVFRFVVLSDRTSGRQEGLLAQAVGEINRLKPDLVMCVGDLVEGEDTDDDPYWRHAWDELHHELSGLQAPFFYCPGNHDVFAPVPRRIYTGLHGVNGRTYYSFNYRGCHFAVLDSTIWHTRQDADAGKAELQWLRQDLAAARPALHTFVFVHHPLFEEEVGKDVLDLVDKERTTFFSGHWHSMWSMQTNGIPYYVVASTSTGGNDDSLDRGNYRQFDFVTVQEGRPTIAVVPVGQIRPPDWMDEGIEREFEGASTNMSLTTVPAAGGESTLRMANNSDLEVVYNLAWNGYERWLDLKAARKESVTLGPNGTFTRTYLVPAVPQGEPAPQLEVRYHFTVKDTSRTGIERLTLPVAQELIARKLTVTVDGRLGEWADAGSWALNPDARHGAPAASASPNGGSVMVAYDEKNVYFAVKVRDDRVITQGREPWQRDGVEIFWDPRPAAEQHGPFLPPCRQLLLPVPAQEKPMEVFTNPVDATLAKAVQVQVLRTGDGYVEELAIPLSCMAQDFVAGPGKTLRIDVVTNDKDTPEGWNTVRSLSGHIGASRRTDHYCLLKFE